MDINTRDVQSSIYNGLTNVIYNKAINSRNLTDDIIEKILSLKINEFMSFNERNYVYMQRLMKLNIYEHETTLNALSINNSGDRNESSFRGDSDSYNSLAVTPSYAKDRSYLDTFVRQVKSEETNGVLSTRETITDNGSGYNEVVNLYPDDLGTGDFKEKWNVNSNKNSILNKTKKLFINRNINTLISRFGTGSDEAKNINYNGSISTKYGESRGRNLLKKGAEKDGKTYDINGYNNPYCRVWTHHYKYDKISKTMRSLSSEDGNTIKDSVHTWNSFKNDNENGEYKGGFWKDGSRGWDKSVLDSNGMPKITPKYSGNGKNIHTKDCMFSIENLAWKDYNPFSFENALSWEQRGPNGGRIMWFPPYGINFSESTNANWSSNTFIGRGEDVYTYVNTARSGSLSFLMVVDHPSVIDYALWDEKGSKDINDNDLLRFFAGCDSLDSSDEDSLLSKVKPTPLTDEMSDDYYNEETIRLKKNKNYIQNNSNSSNNNEIKISFPVYFPNNYSGCYDDNGAVDPIAYLLCGIGCQKNKEADIPISFKEITNGDGYEMGIAVSHDINSQEKSNNFIEGSKYKFKIGMKYEKDPNKKWYYRIDGEYSVPRNGRKLETNTYDQIIAINNNKDTQNFNLNKDIEVSKKANVFSKETNAYSFLDVAIALSKIAGYNKTYEELSKKTLNIENSEKLFNLFSTYELKECTAMGCASIHGYTNNNELLARNRAITIKEWVESIKDEWSDGRVNIDTTNNGMYTHESNRKKTVSDFKIKLDRCVIVDMIFNTDAKIPLSETNQKDNPNVIQEYIGYDKISDNLYKDSNGRVWKRYREGDTEDTFKLLMHEGSKYGYDFYEDKTKIEKLAKHNTYRYDQEYHFFKELKKDSPIVYKSLMDKLKYFDPAFHSMTPEGFNGRLTFLQQCMRQGNTKTMSDGVNGRTANNLAFGRPPFCVLRIGDFYNQTIIIESLNIDYNVSSGIQWDFNIEGAGVQPLLANITLNFKFIGGGDLTGPIKRLQNAMSFNYYANTRLYDNRADRHEYNTDEFGRNSDLKMDESYSYNAEMTNNDEN